MKKLALLIVVGLSSSLLYAGGYRVSIQGQRALAMGHTGVAVVNNAELAFFNPAGLVYLERKLNVAAGGTGIISNLKYQNLETRQAFSADNPLGTPFSLYASYKITDYFTAALAIYTPYGSSVEWPQDWAGSHLVNSISLKSIFINPVFSLKVNDALSIGGGPIFVTGGVEFNRNQDLTTNSLSGRTNIDLDAKGVNSWGWVASVMFRPSENLTMGASYRSEINLDAEDGDVSIINGPSISSSFDATLPLPAELTLGISYKPIDKLLLAFDYNVAYWSVYRSLDIEFSNPALPTSINPRNYQNASTYRVGAQYQLNDKFTFRAGYYFDESPVSSGFFSPETPRNDSNGYTTGLSYNLNDKFAIDASFLYLHFNEVDESYDASPDDTIPVFGGTYKSNVFAPGIGITYKL